MLSGAGQAVESPVADFLGQRQLQLQQQAAAQDALQGQQMTGEILDFRTQQKLDREFAGQRDAQIAAENKKSIAEAAGAGGFASSAAAEAIGNIENQLQNTLSRRREIDQINKGAFTRQLQDQFFQRSQQLDNEIAKLGFEQAKEQAKINSESRVDPFTAIKNLQAIMPKEAAGKVNWTGTKLAGYMVNDNGDAILDSEGNRQTIGGAPDQVKYEKATIGEGDNKQTVYVNPFDPTDYKIIGKEGTSYHQDEEGIIRSAPSSNVENAQVIGQDQRPDLYQKNIPSPDGNMTSLAENCVLFAREMADGTIDKTRGLFTKQDKQDAIDRVGVKDPSQFKAGDVILTGEGDWGHAAIISSIDENGIMTLSESNYDTGKVTNGRQLDANDPTVLGALPADGAPDETVFIGNEENEGFNPSITGNITNDMIEDVLGNVSVGLTKDKAKNFQQGVERFLKNGQIGKAKDLIERAAIEGVDTETGKVIQGNEVLLTLIDDVERDLQEYEALGGETGIFTGNAQKVQEALGKVGDPKLAKLANKIQISIQKYRKAISGAAFTESEGAEYKAVFPSTDKTAELNAAKISAIKDVSALQNEAMYKMLLGEDSYTKLFGSIAPQQGQAPQVQQQAQGQQQVSFSAARAADQQGIDIQAMIDAGISIPDIENALLNQ